MVEVIGVRFKKAGKIYYFDPDGINIQKEDHVIVETVRGVEYGSVVVGPKMVDDEDIVSPLKKVLRVATEEDEQIHLKNKDKEKDAFEICLEKIEKHGLEMKLIDVEYTFDNNKVIFYFTADGRVDFRELVKDLASVFRTRIELRQIGVRDEAKMMNGIGPCGIPLCCANWLGEFDPVSIKMAKDQNLSLNPTKISGICGRLMCCLRYEYDTYKKLLKMLPRVGEKVETPDGNGIIIDRNILLEEVKVKLIVKEARNQDESHQLEEDVMIYSNERIKRLSKAPFKGPKNNKPKDESKGVSDHKRNDRKNTPPSSGNKDASQKRNEETAEKQKEDVSKDKKGKSDHKGSKPRGQQKSRGDKKQHDKKKDRSWKKKPRRDKSRKEKPQ